MIEDATDEEIDLRELFSVMWAAKFGIAFFAVIAAVLSVSYSLSLPNIYTSSALLSPTEDSTSGIGGLLSQYSGLASMAGVTLPTAGGSSKAGLAMKVAVSRAFAKEFIDKHGILPQLLAVDYWDESTRQLVFNPELYNEESGEWVRAVNPPKKATPSDQEAFEAFKAGLVVNQDQKTNFVTVSIKHKSPDVAKQWVEWLVQDVNETMRRKDIKEAQESIRYLESQAAKTALADLDQVFFDLMQAQMQRMMLAEVRREYVLSTIDPAISPELKSEPSRALICIMGTIIGAFLGVVLSLVGPSSWISKFRGNLRGS